MTSEAATVLLFARPAGYECPVYSVYRRFIKVVAIVIHVGDEHLNSLNSSGSGRRADQFLMVARAGDCLGVTDSAFEKAIAESQSGGVVFMLWRNAADIYQSASRMELKVFEGKAVGTRMQIGGRNPPRAAQCNTQNTYRFSKYHYCGSSITGVGFFVWLSIKPLLSVWLLESFVFLAQPGIFRIGVLALVVLIE